MGNIFDTSQGGGYVFDDSKWHYDPANQSADCDDGSNSIVCPSQIQLGFFDNYNFVIALIFVVMIYILFNYKKNVNKKSKRKRKK